MHKHLREAFLHNQGHGPIFLLNFGQNTFDTKSFFPVLTRCRLFYGQRQAHLRIVSHRRKQFAFNFCHSVLIGPHYKHTLQ